MHCTLILVTFADVNTQSIAICGLAKIQFTLSKLRITIDLIFYAVIVYHWL